MSNQALLNEKIKQLRAEINVMEISAMPDLEYEALIARNASLGFLIGIMLIVVPLLAGVV